MQHVGSALVNAGNYWFIWNITNKACFRNVIFNQNFLKLSGKPNSPRIFQMIEKFTWICQIYDFHVRVEEADLKQRDSLGVCAWQKSKPLYGCFRFTTWYVFWSDSMRSKCHVLLYAHFRPYVLCHQSHFRIFIIS